MFNKQESGLKNCSKLMKHLDGMICTVKLQPKLDKLQSVCVCVSSLDKWKSPMGLKLPCMIQKLA